MRSAVIKQVVVANNATRGTGKDQSSPVRGITEIYTDDGLLIAVRDHYTYTIEDVDVALTKMGNDGLITAGVLEIIQKYFKK